jgi:hypothetical protein
MKEEEKKPLERDYDILLPKDDTVAPLKIVAEQLNEIGIKNVLINTDSKTKNKIRCNINWEFAWHRDPINYPLNTNPNEDVKFSLSGVNFIIVSEPEPKKEHYPSNENTPNK